MIFKTTDPLHRDIILKKTTWENKIINVTGSNNGNAHGNSHPEMSNQLDNIRNSVTKPTYILNDMGIKVDENGNDIEYINHTRQEYLYFHFDQHDTLKVIKTVVDFSKDPNYGEIVTTHFMTGPIKKIKAKGGIVYDANGQ